MSKNKHLALDDRCSIEHGLNKRLSFKAIGAEIDKDCTTISKEIRSHIVFEKKGAPYRPFNDCLNRMHCYHIGDVCEKCTRKHKNKCSVCGACRKRCPDYKKQDCPHLLNPPYVCNGCDQRSVCTLEKHLYHAVSAQREYETVLRESRSGVNLTEKEQSQLDGLISPLLKNGQSIHHILVHNQDTIMCCEKTLYSYADLGLFQARNIDMPRKVRFKPRKKKSVALKVDKKCRIGRSFEDFKRFQEEHPDLTVVELDSVEGVKGGAVLLTIHFVFPKFQLAFMREANDSRTVTDIFNNLYDTMGAALYKKLFPVLLADNGSEFSDPASLEFAPDGERRSHLFYCNLSAPHQKGSCEVNHEFIRRIIPKGVEIGNYSQDQIRLMMNHVNSYSRPEIGNKAPYEMMAFFYGKNVLDLFEFKAVAPNDIILKPSLLIP